MSSFATTRYFANKEANSQTGIVMWRTVLCLQNPTDCVMQQTGLRSGTNRTY